MRFEQLKCIIEIANSGSITAAAHKLFISQQAVSANVKQLEEELGCKLLIREKDGVSLTAQGKETVDFAHEMLDKRESFYNRIRSSEEKESLMIRVCSTSSVTNIVLPNVIERMESKQKKVNLKITIEDDLENLFEQVKNRDMDVGLLTFNAEELDERFAAYSEILYLDILVRDELIVVLNKKFMEEERTSIEKSEFDQKRQSVYNILPSRKHFQSTKEKATVWSNDSEFHRAMLERNGTLVLMPSLAYQYFFSQKKYIALPLYFDVPLIHAAVYRKDAPQYVQEFVNMIRLEMHMK